jgi:acetoin utilization deacetylase AcuC-like enzyme
MVVDIDVHHGNGTYDILGQDPRVAIVDMHQRDCYPPDSGHIELRGVKNVLNLDLSPGTGHDTAMYMLEKVIKPAIKRQNPEIILISGGYDAGLTDPLGRFMFGPMTFKALYRGILQAAGTNACKNRVVVFHEGGYEEIGVAESGLGAIEELSGIQTGRVPTLDRVTAWQNKGLTQRDLALQHLVVDEVARLVPEIPRV